MLTTPLSIGYVEFMRSPVAIVVSGAAATLGLAALLVSCNTESTSENNVRVTPARVRLANGQTQVFTASGGYEYRWSLEGGGTADEWGRLSSVTGPTTTYTSNKDASTSGVTRVVRVTSTISGSGSTTSSTATNVPSTTTSYSMTAEAYVEHAVAYGTLSVSPAAVSGLKFGQSQAFTASGGDGTYTWSIANRSIGTISSANGGATTYAAISRVASDDTVNYLNLQSGDGQRTTAAVFHSAESSPTQTASLALSPATASVTLNGTVSFTATGGDNTYSWSIDNRSFGMLTAPSASTIAYTCTNAPLTNTVVILRVNSNGERRQATILHSGGALRILPSSAELTATNPLRTFEAFGGDGNYDWNLSSTMYGDLIDMSGSQATFERSDSITNTATIYLYVRSGGEEARATLTVRH